MTGTGTHSTHRPKWLMRLRRPTIWNPDAIPVYEGATSAELKRELLPVFDLILVIMGSMAVVKGMPTFDIVYNDYISTAAAITLLSGAAIAAFGLIFPRFWRWEAVGKIVMFAILTGYSIALWSFVATGEDGRGFVAGAVTALSVFVGWNLKRIGRERRAGTNGKGKK